MKITIPAAAWLDALDPSASGMQEALGLPEPRYRRHGYGGQYVYDGVEEGVAGELADYLADRAHTLLGQDEEDAAHRASLKAAGRIRAQLGE